MHIPLSTYRIQFSPSFKFIDACQIVPYLKELGIGCLYVSPIFMPRKGSTHGYDIVDPCQLNPELGSEDDFKALIDKVKEHNLFWFQDIVPNHMACDSQNQFLMDVFAKGRKSKYAEMFDIEWDHNLKDLRNRLLAPFWVPFMLML